MRFTPRPRVLAVMLTATSAVCATTRPLRESSIKALAFDKMLAFLDDMQEPEELRALPSWKVHTLTGDRKGTWSLSVTRNRRLTFRFDATEREIFDLNLEDYH